MCRFDEWFNSRNIFITRNYSLLSWSLFSKPSSGAHHLIVDDGVHLPSLAILRRTPWRLAAANAGKKSETLGPAASTDASSTTSLTSRAVPGSRSAENMGQRGRQPLRGEELGGAQPPQGAPLAARGQAEHAALAVAARAHGVADGPGRDGGVVPLEDLAGRVRGQGDDGEDGAEAERHERAVPRGEAREGAVRQRERPWAWWKAAARIVEELEGIGGEDDEQGNQHER
ncbi:hypothetical protein BS78_05G249600 [Paspalum vaginatum]|nr:hypothetical protein BS78_05G249600 [Paspalum vaginatum]